MRHHQRPSRPHCADYNLAFKSAHRASFFLMERISTAQNALVSQGKVLTCSCAATIPMRLLISQYAYCNQVSCGSVVCFPTDTFLVTSAHLILFVGIGGVIGGGIQFVHEGNALPQARVAHPVQNRILRCIHSVALYALAHYAFYNIPVEHITSVIYPIFNGIHNSLFGGSFWSLLLLF